MGLFDQFGGFMERLTGKGPEADLDKVTQETKEELQKLKEGQSTADAVLTEGLKGLRKDLEELGIKDPAKLKEYEDKYVERFQSEMSDAKMEAISASPEFAGLNDFVGEYANYAQLDSLIAEAKKTESSDPIIRFANQLKSTLPDWATSLIGMGIGMFAVTPEPGKEPSPFEKKLLEVAAILSGEEAKKPEVTAEPATTAVAATTPETTTAPEKYEAETKKLVDAKLPVDKATFEKGVEGMSAEDVTALIDKAIKTDSNSQKAKAKIQEKLGDHFSEFKFSVADIKKLEALTTDAQNEAVATALNDKTSLEQVRQALDTVLTA